MKQVLLLTIFNLMISLFNINYLLYAQENDQQEESEIEEPAVEIELSQEDSIITDDLSESDMEITLSSNVELGSFTGLISEVTNCMFFYHHSFDSLLYHGNIWKWYYSNFPYDSPHIGLFSSRPGKRQAIFFAGHRFFNSNNFQGTSYQISFSPHPIFGLKYRLSSLTEKINNEEDFLTIYNLTLNYNRFRLERFVLWWGMGVLGIEGDKSYPGFDINLGTEIYLVKPISFHGEFDVSLLSNKPITEIFLCTNFHIKRLICYFGYQSLIINKYRMDGFVYGVGIHI
jgi:hypothetical protein